MTGKPTAIDLFAGAGGLSLGCEQAGMEMRVAVESDPIHATVHQYNFPRTSVLARSVVGLKARNLRKTAGIEKNDLTLLCGGPPCQGFSLIGKRALDDPRNSLVGQFIRLVKELQPLYFLMENVKGLTIGNHRQFLGELLESFTKLGYRMPNWQILNACNYGVPQARERLILLGSRQDQPPVAYPEPTTKRPRDTRSILPNAPTCREALEDILSILDEHPELQHGDTATTVFWEPQSVYAQSLHAEPSGPVYPRFYRPNQITNSQATRHSPETQRRFAHTPVGTVEPNSRLYRLDPEEVSHTLRAGTDASHGSYTSPWPIHYEKPRCITVREMARLQGFPDWFRFHSTIWHGGREVGNSVPPPMARTIVSKIMKAGGFTPKMASGNARIVDENLPHMNHSKAELYWQTKAPHKMDTHYLFFK